MVVDIFSFTATGGINTPIIAANEFMTSSD